MEFDITHGGRTTLTTNYADAMKLGYPVAAVSSALKNAAKAKVAAFADGYRNLLAQASASKLAEYRIKEEIARDSANASEIELGLLTREAEARGTDLAGLIVLINTQAGAYRQISLLIGALEAEACAGISEIADDDADIESLIDAVLANGKSVAEAEYQSAAALMAGG